MHLNLQMIRLLFTEASLEMVSVEEVAVRKVEVCQVTQELD